MKEEPFLSGWRLKAARILSLVLVVGITVAVFIFREQAQKLAAYGYLGIFLISIIANATVILPVPGVALTFTLGAVFNPLGVALASAAGASLGELTGYLAGFSGEGIIPHNRTYQRIHEWTARHGSWVILVLAFIPNPLFDLAGAAAGALRMPLVKFLFWAFLGKLGKMLLFAYGGAFSADWVQRLLGGTP
jgi:uncharacterized membrane protein YdjX (TVP38/TMEM64 family)